MKDSLHECVILRTNNMMRKILRNSTNLPHIIIKKINRHSKQAVTISSIKNEQRVPFEYEQVACNWGVKGAGLPHFSARIYKEVGLLKEALKGCSVKNSLEIGCGYGRLTPWIAEHSEQHYAVEPEPKLRLDAELQYPDVIFHEVRAQELPFPDDFFDLCVTWTVLQHIPPGELLERAVAEIKRVCAPHSVIVLAEGIGTKSTTRYWEHDLEEYRDLLSPWKLKWSRKREIERTFQGDGGLVMRFMHD